MVPLAKYYEPAARGCLRAVAVFASVSLIAVSVDGLRRTGTGRIALSARGAGYAPLTITFHATVPAGGGSWALTFGDGTADATGQGAPPSEVDHTYALAGQYTARLAFGSLAARSTSTIKVVAHRPQPASASLAANPRAGAAPLVVDAVPVVKARPDDPIGSWSLSFGDGSVDLAGRGGPPRDGLQHMYRQPGRYALAMTVTAKSMLSTFASTVVQVLPSLPAVAIRPSAPSQPDSFTTTLVASTTQTSTWSLSFGDGTPMVTGTGQLRRSLVHRYAAPGVFTATLSGDDVAGRAARSSAAVQVGGAALATAPTRTPVRTTVLSTSLSASPSSGGTAPAAVSFDGSGSSDIRGRLTSWRLTFGDESPPATGTGPPPSPTATHIYISAGVYTSTLTISDGEHSDNVSATTSVATAPPVAALSAQASNGGIHKIQHVIVIMQENRSFDNYFGTYPGADGIPRDANGKPTVCDVEPVTGKCVAPYLTTQDIDYGGPHAATDDVADVDGGKMDGFVAREEAPGACSGQDPACTQKGPPDVMGYHDGSQLTTYWPLANSYVLQDHMFNPAASWSLPSHLFMVSGWSAKCTDPTAPPSCQSELSNPDGDSLTASSPTGECDDADPPCTPPDYGWTDLSYMLYHGGVSWRYYRAISTPDIWNPFPDFQTVHVDHQLAAVESTNQFYADAAAGMLPAVSWIAPAGFYSEHPAAPISAGQSYVKKLVTAIMSSPDWDSSAIFLAWDDWGGFYDHVVPPKVDQNGYGLRVPGLLVSPYARQGFVDHQILSFDAYLKFIEDDFLDGRRIDPKTDGRPDPRPDVREDIPILGDLSQEFDFTQAPRAPIFGTPHPPPTSSGLGTAPLSVTFSGSQSTGSLASWTLAFGDGTPPVGGTGTPPSPTAQHVYRQSGSYSVKLTVTDQTGATSRATARFQVLPAPPTASVTASPALGFAPQAVTFDGSQSTDPDDAIASWALDFGDGTPFVQGVGPPPQPTAIHTYQVPGTAPFTATLTVTDQRGLASSAPVSVTVKPPGPPRVTTSQTGVVQTTSFVGHATIDPNGADTSFVYQWGPSTTYGQQSPVFDAGSGTTIHTSYPITGLLPGTPYHYRVVATNRLGTTTGNDVVVTTDGIPVVRTGTASMVDANDVAVQGTVDADGRVTSYHFDYGPTTSYGQRSAPISIPATHVTLNVSAALSSLSPGALYHYRLVAVNSLGTSYGSDNTFATPP